MRLPSGTSKPASDANSKPYNKRSNFVFALATGIVLSLIFSVCSLVLIKNNFPDSLNGITPLVRMVAEKGNQSVVKSTSKKLSEIIDELPNAYFRSLFHGTDETIPRLHIDIAFKPLQKLYRKRSEALQAGQLVKGKNDYVPAKIRMGNSSTKVKLRLKGDHVDHIEGDKWSFRVETKGKREILSMRRFSLQHPRTRGYHGEIFFHETLAPYNVLTPRYSFVDVVINGDELGIMALEEHFSKELLENNGRKEGVIIRFDESHVWHAIKDKKDGFDGAFDTYLNATIDAFGSSKITKSERLSKEYAIAVGLLRGFTDGSMTASEVFDVEQMGSYIAVSQFWGAWHALRWHNLRFYLNPLTMKLEPIAFDANLHERRSVGKHVAEAQPIISHMLQDSAMYAAYNNTLNDLAQQVKSGELIQKLQQVEQRMLNILSGEYFLLKSFDFGELAARAKYDPRKQQVQVDPDDYPVFVNSYTVIEGNKHTLELANPLPYPVAVRKVFWDQKANGALSFEPTQAVRFPIHLPAKKKGELPQVTRIEYQPNVSAGDIRLQIETNIIGNQQVRTSQAISYSPPLTSSPMPKPDKEKMLANNQFMEWQQDSAVIYIRPGRWKVSGNIVIPAGHQLAIGAGTTLQFEPDASVIVYGATQFLGTEDLPIVLEGLTAEDGSEGEWQGVAVYHAEKRSQWHYVEVNNTTGISWPLWDLTGGITFYRSDIDLAHCSFKGNKAEDALNIIHSDFTQKYVSIFETVSDAFDGDFVTGSVSGGLFQDIGLIGGGDGIDVSGSNVSVEDSQFIRVNDKALSVGEGSKMTATNVSIEDSGVGAASKDRSMLRLMNSRIRNASVAGLMSYVKKPEFGGASLIADKLILIDTEREAIAQKGSELTLNGETIKPTNLDIEKLYKTVMKPGLRR